MIVETARVIEHKHFIAPHAEEFHLLTLLAPEIAAKAQPGQFVMLRIGTQLDPLLRRPFSIFWQEEETISLLYKVVGKGTHLMAQWQAGQEVNILGPLGQGFTFISGSPQWLVAGGAGIAPLFFLAKQLSQKNISFQLLWGLRYRVAQELIAFLKQHLDNLTIYTEDGSLGYQGLVTEGVEHLYQQERPQVIYACGPMPMLRALYAWTKKENIPLQVSLEAHMACGVGACLGCVVETTSGYKKVCQDGPVFNAEEIKWEK